MVDCKSKRKIRKDDEWLELINECRSSGMSDKAWCLQNDIKPNTFYAAIKRLRMQACDIPAPTVPCVQPVQEIVEIDMSLPDDYEYSSLDYEKISSDRFSTAPVRITVNSAEIQIFNSADAATIFNIVSALQKLC